MIALEDRRTTVGDSVAYPGGNSWEEAQNGQGTPKGPRPRYEPPPVVEGAPTPRALNPLYLWAWDRVWMLATK